MASPAPTPRSRYHYTLPYRFKTRSYQTEAWQAMLTRKRGALVWHRRAGKDKFAVNFIAAASQRRVGTYYHVLPTLVQGRRIIWDGMDREGQRFLAHFPEMMISHKNEAEMRLEFTNGSAYQVLGTDHPDALVGTNPVGVVFSEYALQNPRAWDLARPILMENGGMAMFISTPRGKNHLHRLWQGALKSPDVWYTSLRTVRDTWRDAPGEDGQPIITQADIEAEIASGLDEELVPQEFFCSFEGSVAGAYYGKQLQALEAEGRFTPAATWIPELPVNTFWDIGVDDATSIWFEQDVGERFRFIEYFEASGEGLPYYIRELKQRPYVYGRHYGPFDLEQRDFTTGLSRRDSAWKLGLFFNISPRILRAEGIDAARRLLPRCEFHPVKCERGYDGLQNYTKERDEKTGLWRSEPVHDWTSHPADAFRCFAVSAKLPARTDHLQTHAYAEFDPRAYTVSAPDGQQAQTLTE